MVRIEQGWITIQQLQNRRETGSTIRKQEKEEVFVAMWEFRLASSPRLQIASALLRHQ